MDAIELLATRASCSKLVEPAPDDAQLAEIVEAALRAPDHANLRPWQILSLRGEARAALGELFAALVEGDEKKERAARKPLRAPLILIVAATPSEHPKVPEIEQILSAGAVAHGVLLGLHARGFAGIWRTGAPTYDASVKAALGLRPQDQIVAFIYAGTASVTPSGARPPLTDHLRAWDGDRGSGGE